MRSFVKVLTAALLLVTTMPILAAPLSQSQRLFNDALERERTLRNELESTSVTAAILPRARALIGAYEDLSKLFPTSGVSDNALWQGARLAADVFWQFGDALDRSLALRLFNTLTTRFPSSSLARQVAEQKKRLNDARPAPSPPSVDRDAAKKKTDAAEVRNDALRLKADAAVAAARLNADPSTRPKPDATPAVRSKIDVPTPPAPASSGVAALSAIRREVLPEALRITLELGREVMFANERLDGPPRVFIDMRNTRAVETLREAVIPFSDDVVKQIRVGQQVDQRTRVVMDLRDVGRYSVYTLYNPYRIVIDFERPPAGRDVVVARNAPSPRAPANTTAADPKPKPAITPRREAAVASAVQAKPAVLTTPVDDTIAATLVSNTEPKGSGPNQPVSAVAIPPTPVGPIGPIEGPPTIATPIAPTTLSATVSAPALPVLPPPAPPSTNRNGNFSLSRQLGLGISKIVIDAGHGGHDPGAQARGLTEAELVLDVALRLEKLLEKTSAFEVVLTRRTNTYVSLEERTAIANRVFLSIHSNASATPAARGIETYFLNFAPNPEAEAVAARENAGGARTMRSLPEIVRAIALNNKIDESRDFASMVQNSMYSQMRKSNAELRNLGVKQAPFLVLIGATMPSVLAEISFITNTKDAALLKTDKYRQQIAESLLSGVIRYQQSLKRAPAIATTR
jgi:N-acetylmuramoyl-L-alanine amidase